jgi:sulfur carrier protein
VKITVNGEPREVPADTTIRTLVEREGLGSGPVAVERNGDVVRRRDHEATVVAEGDAIEIVHFVGGG